MTQTPRLSTGAKWAALGLLVALLVAVLLAATEGVVRARQLSRHGTASSFERRRAEFLETAAST